MPYGNYYFNHLQFKKMDLNTFKKIIYRLQRMGHVKTRSYFSKVAMFTSLKHYFSFDLEYSTRAVNLTKSARKPLNVPLQLLCLTNAKEKGEGQEGPHSTFTRASRSYSLEFISKNSANPFSTIKHSSWRVKQSFLSSPPLLNCLSSLGEKALRLPCPECLALLQAALNEVLATLWHCRRLSAPQTGFIKQTRTAGKAAPDSRAFTPKIKRQTDILEYRIPRTWSELIRCHFSSPPRKGGANTL